jgi:hypothetical protein
MSTKKSISSASMSNAASSVSGMSNNSNVKDAAEVDHKRRERWDRMLTRFGAILWIIWVHFGVSFMKGSIFLSVFYSSSRVDMIGAITISFCAAMIDYAVHSIFNHQHLSFNLTAGFAMMFRKYVFKPLQSTSGKLDTYGYPNATMMDRFPTVLHEMINLSALVVGSIAAASFNIKVVFPQKDDSENWKFISHTRSSLTSMEVFGIGVIGFMFLAVMIKQMHFRIKTNIPLCAKDVSCDVDCALDSNQISIISSVSFVSSFWLYVAIGSPNNLVVVLGAAIIANDYNNLGSLFLAELLVWFVVEHAYYFFNRRREWKSKHLTHDDSSVALLSSVANEQSKTQSHSDAYDTHHSSMYNYKPYNQNITRYQ